MTDLEEVSRQLDSLKTCTPSEIHTHLAPALYRFRFLPAPDRRALADAFGRWATEHAADAPVKRGYAVFVQAIDRFISEEHEASLQLLTRARTTFAECNDAEGRGLSAMLIGAVYRTFGNFDLALKTLWEGFELLKASGHYPVFLAANANSMANIDFDLGHMDEAISMFNITYEESTKADDFYFMVYALHGLGRVYMHQDKHDQAQEMFTRALALAEQHENAVQTANSLTELATLAYRSGDLSNAETRSGRALAIREQHHLLGGAITNCIRLADIHSQRSEWPAALAVLNRALTIADEVKVKPKIAQVHQMLSHVHERMGELDASLAHFKKYHALREQVEREDSTRKLADAKLIFEAEQAKKEHAIIKAQKEELAHKNVELQDTIDELTRAKIGRKAKTFTLALAIVLFIFQDLILGSALRWLHSNNYFLLLAVKMAIIFSLSPINRGIERHLLRRVIRTQKQIAAGAEVAPA